MICFSHAEPPGQIKPATGPKLLTGPDGRVHAGAIRWKAGKAGILRRDGYRCGYCGRDLLESLDSLLTATIDHIVPRSIGGSRRCTSNQIAACMACNILKGNAPTANVSTARQIVLERRATTALEVAELFARSGMEFPRASDWPGRLSVASLAAQIAEQAEATVRAFRTLQELGGLRHD